MAWPWLTPSERRGLIHVFGHSWHCYAILRTRMATTTLSHLRLHRDHPTYVAYSLRQRGIRLGMLEIAFDFNHGDVIRYLGGEYTNKHRDFQEVYDTMECIKAEDPPAGYPRIEFDQAFRIHTEGAPLAGQFSCAAADVRERIKYNNHEAVHPHQAAIREKFVEEEGQSFHIMLPRFLAMFLFGLFVSPITWAMCHGKGRLCVDSSSRLHVGDSGAPNDSIPKPGLEGNKDEGPAIFYVNAFLQHNKQTRNLRISHPTADILPSVP
mgnify:CR=1 FL=1